MELEGGEGGEGWGTQEEFLEKDGEEENSEEGAYREELERTEGSGRKK